MMTPVMGMIAMFMGLFKGTAYKGAGGGGGIYAPQPIWMGSNKHALKRKGNKKHNSRMTRRKHKRAGR